MNIIKKENERMAALTREEEQVVDIEDGEEGEKAAVASKVTARAEAAQAGAEKRVATYKTTIEEMTTKVAEATTKVTTTREAVTKLKSTIDSTQQEIIELTRSLRSKQEFAEKNPAATAVTAEISKLKEDLLAAEKKLKETNKDYVSKSADAMVQTRLIDHYATTKREMEDEMKEQQEVIEEQKAIVKEQEEKAKVATAVSAVTKAQATVFATHQKVVEAEEELNEAKKTKEEKLAELKAEETSEKNKLKSQKDELKKAEDQKKALEAALETTKVKTETTRLTNEITRLTETITKLTEVITKIEKKITTITESITTVTDTWTTTITELTTKLEGLRGDAEKDEAAAAKSVETLPGTAGNKTPKGTKKADAAKKEASAAVTQATAAGPTTGITDVATTVVQATQEAKTKRVQCTRATKRLANQKDKISKFIKDVKEEIEEEKKSVEDCKGHLEKEHIEYSKTQADANAIAAKDATKFQELTLKLKALQLALDNEAKKCTSEEDGIEGKFKKITAKNDQVADLIKFVNQACEEARQAEEEVAHTITIITQIEVVNRLYTIYIETVQALGAVEKAFESKKAGFERERARLTSQITERKKRVSVAEATITTLKAQEEKTKEKDAKEEAKKEQALKFKVLIGQQEDIIKNEGKEVTAFEKELEELDTEWKDLKKSTGKLKRQMKRAQESYEDAQKKLRKQVDVKGKIDEYRKRVETGKKTLGQKESQITKIMGQIKIEVDENKKKLAGLTEQVEDCSRKTTVARTAITTLSSKQSTLEASSKSLKGKDLEKVKKATDKIDAELENAKNQL
jgi:chromosome segregation ATPase